MERSRLLTAWGESQAAATLSVGRLRDAGRSLFASVAFTVVAFACGGPRWLWVTFAAATVALLISVVRRALALVRADSASADAEAAYEAAKAKGGAP